MQTIHRVFNENSKRLDSVSSNSVDLVVTSPPYPMVAMWDELFALQDAAIRKALEKGDGVSAFEFMHRRLDPVWDEIYRVVKNGGIACINIGDATRTLKGDFRLYSNHSRILQYLLGAGFRALPDILWRKQTNAPNKFMGSGMLPAGAYVTLEHEYILILRKGKKRQFNKAEERQNRRESAIFWEERNLWFSDVWMDVKGTGQELFNRATRSRSAAFPFEVAQRLINMFSVRGDTVLDPFLGTGTTTAAAMACGRHSLGFELDANLLDAVRQMAREIVPFANAYMRDRSARHLEFVAERSAKKGPLKYASQFYGFPVVTRQEREIILSELAAVEARGEREFAVSYAARPGAVAGNCH